MMLTRRQMPAWCLICASIPLLACGGSSSTGLGGPGSSALEGTWDITSYGREDLAPSSVTVTGGTLSGSVSFAGGSSSCVRTLDFAIQGDSMTGSSTPSGDCAGATASTLTGTRTSRQPDSETPWNGTWTIQEDGESDTAELTISGLSATSGDFRMSVAGGVATGTGSRRYSFAARRR